MPITKSTSSFEKPTKKIKEQIGGIGLTNLKKRLELNYGPDFYNLDITKEKNKYKIILTGGYASFFKRIIKEKISIDQDITIKGITKVYKEFI